MNNSKTEIWDKLAKTDPKHTKPFKRAGGFSGTALKPIWIVKRMTEEFGACGTGWGINKPDFQVEHTSDETLVYCTVSIWYGEKTNEVYGVGGDKVRTTFNSGKVFADDEAFKKAFTDAVNNALKFIGVGADVHMGQFEDAKYVNERKEEFSEKSKEKPTQSAASKKDLWENKIKPDLINGFVDAKTTKDADEIKAGIWSELRKAGMTDDSWKSVFQTEYETNFNAWQNARTVGA